MSEQQQQTQQDQETSPLRTEDGTLKDQSQSQQQDSKSTGKEESAEKSKGNTLLTKESEKAEGEKKADAKAGAPEKYEDFKAPEGFEIDKATLDKATPMFKEMGLSQEHAQKLVDLYAEISKDAAEAPYKAWEELNKSWQDQVKADPEIGPKLDAEVKPTIAKALATLPPQTVSEFKAAMDLTGAGNHPAFIKAFYSLAKMVTEGGHVSGKGPSEHGQNEKGHSERPNAANAMWPKLNP